MNGRVQDDLPRTNNDLEGWHHRFAGAFTNRHANMWTFISALKDDSTLNHHRIMEVLIGAPLQPQRQTYQQINQRIRTLVANYRNDDIINFLTGISYNLAWWIIYFVDILFILFFLKYYLRMLDNIDMCWLCRFQLSYIHSYTSM